MYHHQLHFSPDTQRGARPDFLSLFFICSINDCPASVAYTVRERFHHLAGVEIPCE